MIINVSEEFLHRLLEALRPAEAALEMNGPAYYMLCQELADIDIDVTDITLGQLAAAYERAGLRYKRMCDRLERLEANHGA